MDGSLFNLFLHLLPYLPQPPCSPPSAEYSLTQNSVQTYNKMSETSPSNLDTMKILTHHSFRASSGTCCRPPQSVFLSLLAFLYSSCCITLRSRPIAHFITTFPLPEVFGHCCSQPISASTFYSAHYYSE